MIRIAVTDDALRQAIEAQRPGWLARAATRTQAFIDAGEYNESSNIWSEIKPVYMTFQHDKCGYCERQLASPELGGTVEHDLEHYRPKNVVPVWPSEAIARARGVDFNFATGDELESGYYWLAYEPLNYCTSCKKCNTPLKSNYFPVAAVRGARLDQVPALNDSEQPFLIYPLGDVDEDPVTLIKFDGVIPTPVKRNGPRWRRAKVTIKFFELDTREELLRERAWRLVALDNALAVLESNLSEARKAVARSDVETMRSPAGPHSSCVRSACDAYIENPMRMRELFAAARDYLESSPPEP